MPFELTLPSPWADRGWKAKIRDKERLEPPHVSIMNGKGDLWRLNLRNNAFLDKEPPPKGVPQEVLKSVRARFADLQKEWDRMYPENPVSSEARSKPKDARRE